MADQSSIYLAKDYASRDINKQLRNRMKSIALTKVISNVERIDFQTSVF